MSAVSTSALAYDGDDLVLQRTREALDLTRLLARGWDPEMLIFAPPLSDALFGWTPCERVGCTRGGFRKDASGHGLCDGCYHNYLANYIDRGVSIDEFKTIPYRATARSIDSQAELCLVCRTPGHERRVRRGKLCIACASVQSDRGQTVEAYVNGDDRYPPAEPRPSLPPCEVVGCDHRTELSQKGLCRTCDARFMRQRRRDPNLDLATFKRRGMFSVVADGRTVDLSALPELVRLQFLLGLQRLIHLGMPAPPYELSFVARRIHEQRVQSLCELDHTKVAGNNTACRLVSVMVEAAEDAATTIDEELHRDVWRVRIIFPNDRRHRGGVLSFENIPQPWLRELAKLYSGSKLGELALSTLRRRVNQDRTLRALFDGGPPRCNAGRHRPPRS
jgi:hypothetical protein